jgi:hypothetical protein
MADVPVRSFVFHHRLLVSDCDCHCYAEGGVGMMRYFRQWLAIRRLNKLVAAAKSAPATVEYRRRRAAGKAGWQRRKLASQ